MSSLRFGVVTWAASMALAGGALASPPRADVSVSASMMLWTGSDYAETLRLFDRQPPAFGFQLAVRGARPVLPWLMVGGRLGWATASAVVDEESAAGTDNPVAPMQFHLVDASAVLRAVAFPSALLRGGVRVHVDFEAGAVLGNISAGGVTQRWVRPRLDLSLFIGGQARTTPLYVGGRFGFQYIPWDGAGGGALDPAFAGFHVGIEGGINP